MKYGTNYVTLPVYSEMLELGGMLRAVNAHKNDDPGVFLESIEKEVDAFVKEAPQFDDLTMMIMRYNGPQ